VKRHAPATERNREPIAAVLREVLPGHGVVLEVASGSGEHAVYFAGRFPGLVWQPSDPDPDALSSIEAWRAEAGRNGAGLANLRAPLVLDAAADHWAVDRADAILCINMVHISPWRATEGLMRGAGRLLDAGAPLILYGPYRRAGVPTAASNEAFDRSLKGRNAEWGLRNLEDVAAQAEREGVALERVVEMPANNLTVVFRRA
jgi:sugar phosphate isomerase/epimerase